MSKNYFYKSFLFIAAIVFAQAFASESFAQTRFKISLDPSVAGSGESLSGRLLIFMTNDPKPLEMISSDYTNPEAVYISGTEIKNLTAGKTIEINADELAFPRRFSEAARGEYQIMALLDRDHSYTYSGAGAGDVVSSVTKVSMPSAETALTLSKVVPERKLELPSNVKLVEFQSPTLSDFWGKPVRMEATVILPPSYDADKKRKFPTVYLIHGYGGSHLGQVRGAANLLKLMTEKKIPEMIYVGLNARTTLGHHVFADSANNGPWGTALVGEFIPFLENRFRMDAAPSGRFLNGHSSGGWSTLWVMITHPDFFGGTWSTAPDPVDFRNFTGPDLTKNPPQNMYKNASGEEYNLVRDGGKNLMTVRQYAEQERVLGYYGGQFASFEAVFSPKGADGQPMPLFDRETGVIDPVAAEYWEKYNITKYLQENWKTLAPKLKGKLHIIVGTADTFHLDEGVRTLEAELKKLGSDAKIEYIEGKNHFNLYQNGLNEKIANEMYEVARPKK